MSYRLKCVVKTDEESKLVTLIMEEGNQYPVGRESTWFQIKTSSVSRIHFHFAAKKGRLYVIDNKSKNGLYLNGKTVESQKIQEGDIIKFGSCKIRVLRIEAPEHSKSTLSRSQSRSDSIIPPADSQIETPAPPPPRLSDISIGGDEEEEDRHTIALDTVLRFPHEGFKIFKQFARGPKVFFEELTLTGEIPTCLMILAAITVVISAFKAMVNPSDDGFLMQTVWAVLLTELGVVLLAVLLHLAKPFMQAEGEFIYYLRFFTTLWILFFPLGVLTAFGFAFAILFVMLAFGAGIYGFILAFHPRPERAVVIFGALLIATLFTGLGIFQSSIERKTVKQRGVASVDATRTKCEPNWEKYKQGLKQATVATGKNGRDAFINQLYETVQDRSRYIESQGGENVLLEKARRDPAMRAAAERLLLDYKCGKEFLAKTLLNE